MKDLDLDKYLDENIDNIANDVIMLKEEEENDILFYVGSMLQANGYTVSDSEDDSVIVAEEFSLMKSLNVFNVFITEESQTKSSDSASAIRAAAISTGGKLKDRLQKTICSDEHIYNVLGSYTDDNVKNVIKSLLPKIATLVGVSLTSGFWIGVIAAVLALIIKLSYNAYCQTYWDKNPSVKNMLVNK